MNRPGGTRDNGDVARGASIAAAKGAGLVLLAIIIGVILLQVVDDGSKPSASTGTNGATTTTAKSTTTTTGKTTTTTKAATTPAKSPSQISVVVLNAGGVNGAAKTMSDSLRTKGYTNQLPASNWSNKVVHGKQVLCKNGLTQEANALAIAVGSGATVQPYPPTPPTGAGAADCIVAVGT